MSLSKFSDDVVPALSERDARTLVQHVTECLRALGVRPTQMGVTLDLEGMWFAATIHGREVSARCGQGNFTYAQVAKDLVLASTDPSWNRLTVQK